MRRNKNLQGHIKHLPSKQQEEGKLPYGAFHGLVGPNI